jgi:hypothetical protein
MSSSPTILMPPETRSPNYPHLTIEKAIPKVCAVYSVRGRRPSSKRTLSRAMGHSGEHLLHIAALRAYGLLEGRGDGLKLTRPAVVIAELAAQPQHPERVRALRRAAYGPGVFDDLREHFGDLTVPPRAACYRWLRDNGFTHRGATRVIHVYRSNLEFLHGLRAAQPGAEDISAISCAHGRLSAEMPGPQAMDIRMRIRLTVDVFSPDGAALAKGLGDYQDDPAFHCACADGKACEVVVQEGPAGNFDVIVIRAGYSPPPEGPWAVIRRAREYRYVASFQKPTAEQLAVTILQLLAIPLIELL